MRHATSRLNQSLSSTCNPEDILGQFYFAFGQGAGTMRVRQEAIAALRHRYYPAIKASAAAWPEAAGSILSLLTQIGRLAALLATQAGRTAITASDFMQARRSVEASVHEIHASGGLSAGPFCPLVADDVELAEVTGTRTADGPVELGNRQPDRPELTIN
jgi:histone H3/H4